jgi:hypothetical protein
MIGTDGEGKVSGDDCTEAECFDMRGKLYLWISLSHYDLLQGFYTML